MSSSKPTIISSWATVSSSPSIRGCHLRGGGVHQAVLGVARLRDLTLAG
ncbi:hypothetical protein [Streptomyces sp. NPDC059743]